MASVALSETVLRLAARSDKADADDGVRRTLPGRRDEYVRLFQNFRDPVLDVLVGRAEDVVDSELECNEVRNPAVVVEFVVVEEVQLRLSVNRVDESAGDFVWLWILLFGSLRAVHER